MHEYDSALLEDNQQQLADLANVVLEQIHAAQRDRLLVGHGRNLDQLYAELMRIETTLWQGERDEVIGVSKAARELIRILHYSTLSPQIANLVVHSALSVKAGLASMTSLQSATMLRHPEVCFAMDIASLDVDAYHVEEFLSACKKAMGDRGLQL